MTATFFFWTLTFVFFFLYWVFGGVFFALYTLARFRRLRKARFSCLYTLLAALCAFGAAWFGFHWMDIAEEGCLTFPRIFTCGFFGLFTAFLIGIFVLILMGFLLYWISLRHGSPFLLSKKDDKKRMIRTE